MHPPFIVFMCIRIPEHTRTEGIDLQEVVVNYEV